MDPTPPTPPTPPTHPTPSIPTEAAPTRVALVGAGFIGHLHLEVLTATPGVEVVAVCDADGARAEAARARFGLAHAATDLEQLVDLGVGVAHLTVPPDLHVPLARRLLELGMGTFAEKPLALTSAEARSLAALAAERGLPLGVNHNNLYHPSFRALVERVEAGEIGRLEHVQLTLSVPLRQLDAGDLSHWMFRAPRNILFEQATHPLSQLERLIGGVQRAETTLLGTRELSPGRPFHERWVVAARGERGTAELYLAFGAPFQRSTLVVLGSDGSLEADLHHDLLSGERKTVWLDFWNSYLAGARRGRDLRRGARRVLRRWSAFTLGLGPRRDAFFVGMRDSIQAFHAAVGRGQAPPVDGRGSVAVIEWCEALAAGLGDDAAPPPPPPPPPPPVREGELPAREGEVVVTGATGFIGRRVVARLAAEGVPTTAVVRRTEGLPEAIAGPARAGDLRLFVADLADRRTLGAALEGAAVCIHLATGGGDTWDQVQSSMVQASRTLGELCAERGVRLVYVSSIAALYTGPGGRGSGGGPAPLGDDHPTDPRPHLRPPYARGKAAAEAALLEVARERNLDLVIARPGVVLGRGTPMQHSGLGLWVRDNHCVGWGRGDHPLPVVWVEDVAWALVAAARHPGEELAGRALNLCARAPLSAADIVAELARCSGRALHFHPRSVALSQVLEIGKWLVKKAGRRPGASFPAWRDLAARSLARPFTCETARGVLGWSPTEEREAFLERAVRPMARPGR